MHNRKGIYSRFGKRVLYALYLFLAVFILLEILLRIYNPFSFRLKGDKIILPVNQHIVIKNTINPRLDTFIVNTRNSFGLRGPEPPEKFQDFLSIVTIGGSTTECFFLNDDSTWPARLGKLLRSKFDSVWVNNAGLSGHSSFGHQVLVNDHILSFKPKVVLFLIGINDIENDGPGFHDKLNIRGAYPDLLHYLYNESEVINVAVNIARGFRAQKLNNTTDKWKPPVKNNNLITDSVQMGEEIKKQKRYLGSYGKRVADLIDSCRTHQIMPVFITQPLLYGRGIDSVTRVDLVHYDMGDGRSGELFWRILQMYNQKMKTVCVARDVSVIDLAAKMPKNSLYFYDASHFTNEGAALVARLVNEELSVILDKRFYHRFSRSSF